MAEALKEALLSITDCKELIVFLVSMIPLIELKGAIPVGAALGLGQFESFLFAFLGSTLVFIPVFFLMIPIFKLLKKIPFIKRFISKLENMLKGKARKMALNAKGNTEVVANRILAFGLFIFVAIPLPVTGIWTGTAIAVFLGLKFFRSILPLAVGNLIAGLLILLLTAIFKDYIDIILYSLLAIMVVMVVVTVIKISRSKEHEELDSSETATNEKEE